ncbi:MAG: glycosyltransferase family 2 protein [Flavisolibacter sp.]|nr:glycosyltransferase family 2 protein [Flavisolibacter sp.]
MKGKLSVVIVCKNEALIIGRTLQSVQPISDDIVVYDSGSTDATLAIARQYGARIYEAVWEGFGRTKQKAITLAQYDWVLSIDADEVPDETLQHHLKTMVPDNPEVVYTVRFKNFFGDDYLRWGEFGGDWHIRLFNRTRVNWNGSPIHEQLVLPQSVIQKKLPGSILHYTMRDVAEFVQKSMHYALLNAEKHLQQGKKATWIQRYIAPLFTFVKFYFFKLGFLDGWKGWVAARLSAFATFVKYNRLHELQSLTRKQS